MTNPTIRPATTSDAAQIRSLTEQLGYPCTTPETIQRLTAALSNSEAVVLVAEYEGAVVAWTQVHLHHSLTSDVIAELSGLVVDERHRSRGIGRLLLAHAEEWARNQNCRALRLRSNVIRERAHAFYESLGYKTLKSQKVFEKNLHP